MLMWQISPILMSHSNQQCNPTPTHSSGLNRLGRIKNNGFMLAPDRSISHVRINDAVKGK